MKKRYLLLRNNLESGPFTIDELIQQQLQPSDLIWVEGQSHSWVFPAELDELSPSVTGITSAPIVTAVIPAPAFSSRKIAVSAQEVLKKEGRPVTQIKKEVPKASSIEEMEMEKRAEEIRKRAMAYVPQHYYQRSPEPVPHSYHHSVPAEDDGSNPVRFVFHRKKTSLALQQLMVVGILSVLVVAAWYGARSPFSKKTDAVDETVTPLVSSEEHTAAAEKKVLPTAAVSHTTTTNSAVVDSQAMQQAVKPDTVLSAPMKPKHKPKTTQKISVPELPKVASSTPADSQTANPVDDAQQQKLESTPTDDPSKNATADQNKKEVTAEPKEKKKGFGLFRGLFKKKKKEEPADTSHME
jgi:hypothetical protein